MDKHSSKAMARLGQVDNFKDAQAGEDEASAVAQSKRSKRSRTIQSFAGHEQGKFDAMCYELIMDMKAEYTKIDEKVN